MAHNKYRLMLKAIFNPSALYSLFPAMSKDIFNQIRLLRAPSNLTLNVPGMGHRPPLWATWASASPPSA